MAEHEIIKLTGFMSGLIGVRGGMPFDDHRDADDPFMQGYQHGHECRESIVAQAIAEMKPQLSSRERLSALVDASEELLEDMSSGSFNSEEFANEVARGRVHLADTEEIP